VLVDYVQILGISGKKRGHYLACVGFKREGEGYGMGVGIWGDCPPLFVSRAKAQYKDLFSGRRAPFNDAETSVYSINFYSKRGCIFCVPITKMNKIKFFI